MEDRSIPLTFVWRRLHSLMGLGLVLFLCEHLLTNSRASLWWGEEGRGFIHWVNTLHHLPYLRTIEILLIGVPIAFHLGWGIRYALTAKYTAHQSIGNRPAISTWRNRAYTWQRWTAWFLVVGLIIHVVTMRFVYYPESVSWKGKVYYAVKVYPDARMVQVADRVEVLLYDAHLESSGFLQSLDVAHLKKGEAFAVSTEFGAVCLFSVYNLFHHPFNVVFYTLFVCAACFHAFNGLWTFLITWGWIVKASAQRWGTHTCLCVMLLFALLGLLVIWSTFGEHLRSVR